MTPASFRSLVWRTYAEQGRHDLPWRSPQLKIRKDGSVDAYRVLVSEIMLQQTQVDRVIPLYKNFIAQFPTVKKLADAPLSAVVRNWQGLGYNRRAKMLQQAARLIVVNGMPREVAALEQLPGIGSYTARAIAAFAFNEDVLVVETNIRTAIIHHFFEEAEKVPDTEIEKILEKVLPKGRAREWYSALMDYGASLKRLGISHNARSTTHVRQAAFVGSLREVRGAVVRELTKGPCSLRNCQKLFSSSRQAQVEEALRALCAEGLVRRERGMYRLVED